MDGDTGARLLYLTLLGVGLALVVLLGRRLSAGRSLGYLAIWTAIILVVALAYGALQGMRGGTTVQLGTGAVELRRDSGGHFAADMRINGQAMRFIVDTGATHMVLSAQDARAAGIDIDDLSFTGRAMTANGMVRTAQVTLDEVVLGDIVDRNIPAAISDGDLGVSLLGMSYLDRFERIEIQGDRMLLER